MSLDVLTRDLAALRHDTSAILVGLGALTDAVGAQGALLSTILEAVTADEPEGSALVDALIRIAAALEDQGAGIEAVRRAIAGLPAAMRAAAWT